MLQLWYYMILLMLSFFSLVNRALALRLQEVVLLLDHNGWLLAESCFANWEDLEWCISAASDFFSPTWLVSACTNLCHVFVTMQVWLPDDIWLLDSSETERIYVCPSVLPSLWTEHRHVWQSDDMCIFVELWLSASSSTLPGLEWKLLQLVQTADMWLRNMWLRNCL